MIGILGGYGNVGIYASRFLQAFSNHALRIGGRNVSKVNARVQTEFLKAEWMKVDACSESEIERFFESCDCILDASTLSESELFQLDSIAEKFGIPLVHLGIRGFHKRASKVPVLYGAGSIPGLSGLIPQYLAKNFEYISHLDFCYGGSGVFSKSAAKDYLEGIFDSSNHSMVFWKNGEVAPFHDSCEKFSKINKLLGNHKKFPYFDEESAEIAHKLNIQEGRWQMCVCGERTLKCLDSVRFRYKQNPEETIGELVRNSQLDCFGLSENAVFECKVQGILNGEEVSREIAIWGVSPSELTGECAAIATLNILENSSQKEVSLWGCCDFSDEIFQKLISYNPHLKMELKDSREEEGEI